jgi:NAD(P)-dependent dehydrogenase (short-subunit alcohol dehydrogenase family)
MIAGQVFMAKREWRIPWFSSLLSFARQDGFPGCYGASRLCKSLMTRALQKSAKTRIFPLTSHA